MNSDHRRQDRLIGVMPVLAALVVHANSHNNVWVAIGVGMILTVVVSLDMTFAPSRVRLLVLALAGILAGLLMVPLGAAPPVGPLPTAVWCALVGLLLGLTVEFASTRKLALTLGMSLGIVVLSLNVELTLPVILALCIFVASFLASTAALSGTFRMELRFLLPFGAFVATSTLLTIGIANGVQLFGGALDRALTRMFAENRASSQVGMGQDLTLTARHSLTPSLKPLLELSTPVGRLRTQVLDHFDGRRWTTSSELMASTRSLDQVPVRAEFSRTVEMVILDDLSGRLPAPAAIWKLHGVAPRIDAGWTMRDEMASRFLTMTGDVEECLPPEAEPAETLLEISDELRQGLGPIAASIVGDSRSARDKSQRMQQYFRSNFAYSLETNLVGAEHPLVILVRQRRAASCSYYASAMAVMLRSQGVPARVVAGLVPEEVNRLTGRVVVRERDAHAWVEAWIPEERRFVMFDPTPWQSRDAAMGLAKPPGIVATISGALISLGRRVLWSVQHDPFGAMAWLVFSPWAWSVYVLVAMLWWWKRRVRPPTWRRRIRLESGNPELRKTYAKYLTSLRRLGVVPQPWETDDELVARLADQRGEPLACQARAFVRLYRQTRFRGDEVDARLDGLATFA